MERGKKVSRDYKRLALLLEVLQSNSEVDYAEQLFELLEKLVDLIHLFVVIYLAYLSVYCWCEFIIA